MTTIIIDTVEAGENNDKRHPLTIMDSMCILYRRSDPYADEGIWVFKGVDATTIPKNLPDYITVDPDW